MNIKCKCKCGSDMAISMLQDEYESKMLREARISFALCPACSEREAVSVREKAREQKQQQKDFANKQSYDARRKASLLDKYHLLYENDHKGANPALFEWVGKHLNDNLLISGESGLCKTRIVQYYAFKLLAQGKKVFFGKTPDLLDELSAAFRSERRGLTMMKELREYDLLILDDIEKHSITASKLQKLWQLIDRRYERYDQECKIKAGKLNPLYIKKSEQLDGWQIWITTNCDAKKIAERFNEFGSEAGAPVIRRIKDICERWKNGPC